MKRNLFFQIPYRIWAYVTTLLAAEHRNPQAALVYLEFDDYQCVSEHELAQIAKLLSIGCRVIIVPMRQRMRCERMEKMGTCCGAKQGCQTDLKPSAALA